MTARKHLKQLVRSRMKKTGETYASARRQVIKQAERPDTDPATRWHFPGCIPATTALRVLLAHAGVRDPQTGAPFSETMLFGIAGGIGIGVFSFFYEKENFASFFVAGRHSWQDDVAYFQNACKRIGIAPKLLEAGGTKAAEKNLRAVLADDLPCIAWVDMAHLPHRALPAHFSGGGYHVITVYRWNEDDGTALIGDLTDEPIAIPFADLAKSRERIKKQKNRILTLDAPKAAPDLATLVREGLKACHQGGGKEYKNFKTSFSLEAIRLWGQRMHGSKDKENWERVFAPGPNLWRGLTSIYDSIEHYGTGGGLCRPLFAEFLEEAGQALGNGKLTSLGERYAALGKGWSELAQAALPDNVPMFREARALSAQRAELTAEGGPVEELRGVWDRLGELEKQAREKFPLSAEKCTALRADLQPRILNLYEGEIAAHAAIGEAIA